jgi:hypothetical protein
MAIVTLENQDNFKVNTSRSDSEPENKQAMKIHLLVIADSLHYDSGLNSRQSYIDQFVQQLERGGLEVVVTYHAPMALCTIRDVLQRVPLRRYDLIILQIANRHLRDARLALRPTAGAKVVENLMAWKLRIQCCLGGIRPLREVYAHCH